MLDREDLGDHPTQRGPDDVGGPQAEVLDQLAVSAAISASP